MLKTIRLLLVSTFVLAVAMFGFMAAAGWLDNIAVANAQDITQPAKKKKLMKNQEAAPAAEVQQPAAEVQQSAAARIAVPAPEVLLIMVRAAVSALDQANKTNNYSVLYGLGSPVLQQHTPEQLSEMFASVRNSNADLQPALVLTPQITQAPGFTADGLLLLTGLFPSQPLQIKFQIAYQPVGPVWRLAAINLSLAPVKAAAVQPQGEAAQAPAQ